MCGICGVYFSRSGKPADSELIERMCSKIRHRGPDDQGTYFDNELGLGVRRLSIIDLDHGSQPIFNEDKSICVVFNGEIYNFQSLRKDLEAQGHRFQTHSDTEVLVHLYEQYDLDFIEKLNGMFAIALWDKKRQRLVLVRDRLGVKPLYYAWTSDGLVFGSELKCLVELEELSLSLDHEAVFHYFTLGYIPHPWSIYRTIRQLPPAHRILVEGDRMTIEEYWRLESQVDHTLSKQEVQERLRSLLTDAVQRRMISDVPLGAFLSGGLDSSIMVALMAQHSASPIKTFFIDFQEPSHSERKYARTVAKHYGTEHHEFVVRPSATEILDDLVGYFDEPFGDSSAVPTYYLSKLTRQHVKVVVSGDGGDESFGGYKRYLEILRRQRLPTMIRSGMGALGNTVHERLPRSAPGRRFFRSLGMENFQFYGVGTNELESRELLSEDLLETIKGTSTFEILKEPLSRADASDPLAPYTFLDLHRYLPDDILVKVDRMSMAHSLEVRGPLLDYRIVELAASIRCDWKILDGDTKIILKETFKNDLPPEIMKPRKRGLSMPLDKWFRGELRPALEEVLHSKEISESGLFKMREIRELAQEHFDGVRDRQGLLWRFLFFARWWLQTYSCLPCN